MNRAYLRLCLFMQERNPLRGPQSDRNSSVPGQHRVPWIPLEESVLQTAVGAEFIHQQPVAFAFGAVADEGHQVGVVQPAEETHFCHPLGFALEATEEGTDGS